MVTDPKQPTNIVEDKREKLPTIESIGRCAGLRVQFSFTTMARVARWREAILCK